jgi:hypothetical protein
MSRDDQTTPPQTVNITSGVVPGAGPCGACGTHTETGLGVWGDTDWCEEILLRFMFRSDVDGAIVEASVRDHGVNPEEILEMGFGVRLCVDCAHKAGLMVRRFAEGEGVAMYAQPGTLPPADLEESS